MGTAVVNLGKEKGEGFSDRRPGRFAAIRSLQKALIMKAERELSAEETATIIELDNCRKCGSSSRACTARVTVMIEIASDDAVVGEDIRSCLARHLEDSGYVTVSDDNPDWVFSIIGFHQGNLVELSVVLRRFFRSTAPGTETAISDPSGQAFRRKGGWIYESLRYHGLHGVPKPDLGDFLKGLADVFMCQHLNLPQDRKKQPQYNR